jgi:hypothetical protein
VCAWCVVRFVSPSYRAEVWGEGVLPVVGSAKGLCLWEGYFFRHQRHAYSLGNPHTLISSPCLSGVVAEWCCDVVVCAAWRVGSELSPTGGLGQPHRGGAADPSTSSRWAAVVDGLYCTDPDVLPQLELLPVAPTRHSPPTAHTSQEAHSRSRGGSNGTAAPGALHRSSSRRGSTAATADTQPTQQHTE